MSEPIYLSIVIAARNDNYGGDFNFRLQNSINWYCCHFEKLELRCELVIVNYNPIAGNRELREELVFPADRKYVTIRIITVSPQVHQTYHAPFRKELPFYEFSAKNMGIRRAKGEYILSTNADVILPPAILKHIAAQGLTQKLFYRADRADYKKFDLQNWSPAAFMSLCREKTFIYFAKGFKYKMTEGLPFWLNVAGIKVFNRFRIKWELFKEKQQQRLNRFKIYHNPHNAEFKYHLNNCGDFMLMHRDHWFELKGNPEKTFISTHTDALFVVTAGVSGLKEHLFFNPVFHQEHERRFGWSDIENDSLFRKVYLDFQDKAQAMIRSGKVIIDNDEKWGGAEFILAEETV